MYIYIYKNNVLLGELLLGECCWAQTHFARPTLQDGFYLRPAKLAQQQIAQQDIVYVYIYISCIYIYIFICVPN